MEKEICCVFSKKFLLTVTAMNPLPKSTNVAYTGPVIGNPKHDGPLVVEIPGYGIDHTLTADSNGQLQRGFRPASVVVDGRGFQQLGGFLNFEELDNALGMKVDESQRKFAGNNVVFDGANNYYVQPANPQRGENWENAAAGLKELLNPVRKVKKQGKPKSVATPPEFLKDGLANQQEWKMISPGEYWPGSCFPLITIRKPVLIPKQESQKPADPNLHSFPLESTLPVQILQKTEQRTGTIEYPGAGIQLPYPVLAEPIKGDPMRIPPALVDNREQTLAASTIAVPLEAHIPTAYGTMQVPISTLQYTQQHALNLDTNNPGQLLVNSPAVPFQPY